MPTSVTEVRAFLGLASYYSRFVRDFSKLAGPLNALLQKSQKFEWTAEAQQSFEALKSALISPPVVTMPCDEGDFTLDTGASNDSIGAVLAQCQDGVERVIAFGSRSLDKRERNNCVTRKELLTIVHFLRYFKQYLLGFRLRVRTDHAALTWLKRTPDLIGQQAKWLEQMEEYNFTIEHCQEPAMGMPTPSAVAHVPRRSVCVSNRLHRFSAGQPTTSQCLDSRP